LITENRKLAIFVWTDFPINGENLSGLWEYFGDELKIFEICPDGGQAWFQPDFRAQALKFVRIAGQAWFCAQNSQNLSGWRDRHIFGLIFI